MPKLFVLFIVIGAALLAACGGGSAGNQVQSLTVTAQEFKFEPAQITVRVGQPVKLALKNTGTVVHDLTIAKIPLSGEAKASAAPAQHEMGHGAEPELHVAAEPGKSGTVEFTPSKLGNYQFICTVAGHLEAGMKGDLIVQ